MVKNDKYVHLSGQIRADFYQIGPFFFSLMVENSQF